MVRKVTKNNYRQFYKEYYGIEFGEDFQVHHIDQNRDNNNIDNLILLPKEVHKAIHSIEYAVCLDIKSILFPDFSEVMFDTRGCGYEIDCINLYCKSISDMYLWKQHKDTNYRLFKVDGITYKKA